MSKKIQLYTLVNKLNFIGIGGDFIMQNMAPVPNKRDANEEHICSGRC